MGLLREVCERDQLTVFTDLAGNASKSASGWRPLITVLEEGHSLSSVDSILPGRRRLIGQAWEKSAKVTVCGAAIRRRRLVRTAGSVELSRLTSMLPVNTGASVATGSEAMGATAGAIAARTIKAVTRACAPVLRRMHSHAPEALLAAMT